MAVYLLVEVKKFYQKLCFDLFYIIDSSGSVKVWDIADGKLLKTFAVESVSTSKHSSIYSLSFCQDGKILASCASDNTVKLWDIQKPASISNSHIFDEPLATFHTKQTPIMTARFTPRNVLSVIGAFATE